MATTEQVGTNVSGKAEVPDMVQRLAERIGLAARASAVFGDPVERAGITVIPVAKSTWGFGGGSGGEPPNAGTGAGGGGMVTPIGFIEVRDEGARFVPLRDLRRGALWALTGAVVGWLARRR